MPKQLPPDAELQALAAKINAQTRPSAAMHFYRIPHEDGSIETGIVYESGSRRGVVTTKEALTIADADTLVKKLTNWRDKPRVSERYSEDAEFATMVDYRNIDF